MLVTFSTLLSIWCFKVWLSRSVRPNVTILLSHATLFMQLIQNRQIHDSASRSSIYSYDISYPFISCDNYSSDTVWTCMHEWMEDKPNWDNARQIYIKFCSRRQFWIIRFSNTSFTYAWVMSHSISTATWYISNQVHRFKARCQQTFPKREGQVVKRGDSRLYRSYTAWIKLKHVGLLTILGTHLSRISFLWFNTPQYTCCLFTAV